MFEFIQRQIDAPAPCILADVADDVGKLESDAEIMRIFKRPAVAVAENFRGKQSDHRGDAIAVELQRLEVRIAVLVEVHFHAVDDFKQVFLCQVELQYQWLQRLTHRVLRHARVDGGGLVSPPVQCGTRHVDVGTFVHHIVHFAAEGI